MQKLIVMSDPHLLPEGARGDDRLARFTACLEHARNRHADAEALVLLGDLAEAGAAAEYARLRRALAGLAMPLLPMMGNHDRRGAFRAAFPEAPCTAAGHVQAVLDLTFHRIITLDTLDTGDNGTDGTDCGATRRPGGRLCPARRAWLEAALAGRGARRPVVFTHHPAAAIGIPWLDDIALADSGAFLALLARHGAQLVSGHVHRGGSGSRGGVPWATVGSTSHTTALDLGLDAPSAAPSPAPPDPPAYGVLLLDHDGGVTLHHIVLPAPA